MADMSCCVVRNDPDKHLDVNITACKRWQETRQQGDVVSGLSSSKASARSMLIKNSAEARLGGMIEQSLLKQTYVYGGPHTVTFPQLSKESIRSRLILSSSYSLLS